MGAKLTKILFLLCCGQLKWIILHSIPYFKKLMLIYVEWYYFVITQVLSYCNIIT